MQFPRFVPRQMLCTHPPTGPPLTPSQSVGPSAPLLVLSDGRKTNDFCPRSFFSRSAASSASALCFYLFPLSHRTDAAEMPNVASFPLDTKTNYSAPASPSSPPPPPLPHRRCHVRLCFRFHAYLHFCVAAIQCCMYDSVVMCAPLARKLAGSGAGDDQRGGGRKGAIGIHYPESFFGDGNWGFIIIYVPGREPREGERTRTASPASAPLPSSLA